MHRQFRGTATECGWKQGDRGAELNQSEEPLVGGGHRGTSKAAKVRKPDERQARHEALPHTPPGGEPPETPAPFPSDRIVWEGGNLSRVRKPRKVSAPLTDFLPPKER